MEVEWKSFSKNVISVTDHLCTTNKDFLNLNHRRLKTTCNPLLVRETKSNFFNYKSHVKHINVKTSKRMKSRTTLRI